MCKREREREEEERETLQTNFCIGTNNTINFISFC
jgi:hypothetical protein